MSRFNFANYNLVATFPDLAEAAPVLAELRQEIDMSAVSVLTPDTATEDRERPGSPRDDATADVTDDVAKGVAAGGAAGGAIGGVAGLLAGAAAVAIPGIGPGLATGIWAGVLGGGFAGVTAGGVAGAFRKMWDAMYLDTLREGGVLIAVHSDDRELFERAAARLHRAGAAEVHHYDHQGELIHSA